MSSNARVVIYSPYAPEKPGAAGMRVHSMKEAFHAAGWDAIILTPADGEGTRLAQRVYQWHPSIVMATSPPLPPLGWVWLGAKMAGAKFVLDAKDDGRAISILAREKRSLKEKAYVALRQHLYTGADMNWFLTPSDRNEGVLRYSLSSKKTMLVPNGVDPRMVWRSNEDEKVRRAVRRENKVAPGTRVILYAGSMGDEDVSGLVEKGLSSISSAVIFWVIAMDNTHEEEVRLEDFKKKLTEKNLMKHSRIFINIPIEEMHRALCAADVGVLPWNDALPTSLPVKLFDYAGAGLRVIARAHPSSEVSRFLEQHPTTGMCAPTWGAFNETLSRELRQKRTLVQREKTARAAHQKWDRAARMKEAVSALLSLFSAENRGEGL